MAADKTHTAHRIVVKLIGDSKHYVDALKAVKLATRTAVSLMQNLWAGQLKNAATYGKRMGRLIASGITSSIKAAASTVKHALGSFWQSGPLGLVGSLPSQVRAAVDQAGQAISALGTRIQALGQRLSIAVTAPIVGLAAISTREFTTFDQNMTEAFGKMGRVPKAVREQMEQIAFDLSTKGEVAFSPAELAKGYEDLAGAGLDAAQSMAVIGKTARFAQAGAFGMDVAVQQLIGAMASYRAVSDDPLIFAKNMEHFSDVIVNVANTTPTSVEAVARAMAADGAVAARNYGMELETLGAILGVYAQQNKHAEEAGNLTGRMLRLLTSSFVANREFWLSAGIDPVDKATGKWLHFADVIDQLSGAMKGMEAGPQMTEFLNKLGFEALAQKSILPLLGMGNELRKLEKQYSKTGVTSEVAAIQMESFQNQLKVIKNTVSVAAIEIGQLLSPAISYVGNLVKEGLSYWKSLSKETKTAVLAIGGVLALAGPLTMVFGMMISFVGSVISSVATLTTVGSLLAIIASAIGGIELGAFLANVKWTELFTNVKGFLDEIGPKVVGFFDNFQENAGVAVKWVIDVFNELKRNVSEIFRWLKSSWGLVIRDLIALAISFAKSLGDVLYTAVKGALNLIVGLVPLVSQRLIHSVGEQMAPYAKALKVAFPGVSMLLPDGKGISQEQFEKSVFGEKGLLQNTASSTLGDLKKINPLKGFEFSSLENLNLKMDVAAPRFNLQKAETPWWENAGEVAGVAMGKGVATGLEDTEHDVESAATGVASAAVGAFQHVAAGSAESLSRLLDYQDMIRGFSAGVKSNAEKLVPAMNSVSEKEQQKMEILNFFGNNGKDIKDLLQEQNNMMREEDIWTRDNLGAGALE